MHNVLRVLIIGHSENDADLILRILERAGYTTVGERVETAAEMDEAIERQRWDIVISDLSLPQFDAFAALHLLQQKDCDIPFIVICGRIAEDTAVSMMKAGAHDYVTRDSLGRLVPAVRRELADSEVRRKNKVAAEALRESEERYRSIIENIPDVFYRTDEHGMIVMASPSATRLLGFESIEEILGMPAESLWADPKGHSQMLQRLDNNGIIRDFETAIKKKDGSPRFVSVTSTFWKDRNGSIAGVEGLIRDITDRKQAEEERLRLVTAIEQSAEAMLITDTNWVIHYVNAAFESMSGYNRRDAIGRHMGFLKGGIHNEEFYRNIRQTLSNGAVWSGRITNRKKDGTFYETEVTGSPVRNQAGQIINYAIVHRDITRQVTLENHLRQAQKMEAIGTLAGGIAHDFNNILSAIMGYAEFAVLKLPDHSPVIRDLQQVLDAGRRASDLVKQILTFSRQTKQGKKPVEVALIVKEVLKLMRSSLPATIQIRQELPVAQQPAIVLADPTEIHQVLMNLCTNSAHAMRTKGGVLFVKLSDIVVDNVFFSQHPDLRAGPYVRITVSDTGHGMDEAVIQRIFDPYFTTKGPGEGTGLGLSVVQGIVKSCNGLITVNSTPEKGTDFDVFLPKIEDNTQVEARAACVLPTGTERILFVDDEEALALLGQKMLISLGYNVSIKTNPLEVLEAFRSDPFGLDLLVTDMTMPDLRGDELAKELLAVRPDLP
ncbi:MAG: PAS domain S-box protein, partial [Syntrophobacteraceae bacterium]